jgi:hypothetical protein
MGEARGLTFFSVVNRVEAFADARFLSSNGVPGLPTPSQSSQLLPGIPTMSELR